MSIKYVAGYKIYNLSEDGLLKPAKSGYGYREHTEWETYDTLEQVEKVISERDFGYVVVLQVYERRWCDDDEGDCSID